MVFSKLFGKNRTSPHATDNDRHGDDAGADVDLDTTVDHDEPDWTIRAGRVIVGGASTGSKRPDRIYGERGHGPTHYASAAGCHVVTVDGDDLVDCTMALGSVALGYAEPELTRSVIEALASGSVSGLSPALEVDVAERLCGVIPCAERVHFLKTGAEAMSAAVRIARTYTGRQRIVGCGYFGWHDWSSDAAGVPSATSQLLTRVPFDDVRALERAFGDGVDVAAIAIEPVIERLPSPQWIAKARELCDAKGAVLIFDEIKTGFRLATGGYQQYAEVTPDLAAFGKAMANGFPIAAVCGHASLMEAADRTWISSTLASETGALAAASAVLTWHDRADVCGALWNTGKEMREGVARALQASGIRGVAVDGIDPMWLLRFDEPAIETDFLIAAATHGVLFKRGAYNFAALAHDDDALRTIEAGASAAFVELRERSDR